MINLQSDKRGVILVFTLILLSVLLSTALGFSYFIIADINKARAIDDSIIAYYAADAGIEESLYLLKKQEATESLNSLTLLNGSGEMNVSGGAWDILDSTDYEKGFLRQRLSNGQSVKFFILNRGLSAEQANYNGAKSISVEWQKGKNTTPNLQVILTQLWPQRQDSSMIYFTDTSELEVADSASNGRGETCYDFKDLALDNNSLDKPVDYLVELKVLGNSDDFVDRIVVKAYNKRCQEADWSKDINETGITNLTLKAKGKYGRSQQSIIAHLLPKDPVSGLLGFVLFSEQDITKE